MSHNRFFVFLLSLAILSSCVSQAVKLNPNIDKVSLSGDSIVCWSIPKFIDSENTKIISFSAEFKNTEGESLSISGTPTEMRLWKFKSGKYRLASAYVRINDEHNVKIPIRILGPIEISVLPDSTSFIGKIHIYRNGDGFQFFSEGFNQTNEGTYIDLILSMRIIFLDGDKQEIEEMNSWSGYISKNRKIPALVNLSLFSSTRPN